MKVGDLVRINEGSFMQGLMGIIVDHHTASNSLHPERWFIRFIGPDVPKPIKHKSIPFRASRFTLIKSSNDGGHKKK